MLPTNNNGTIPVVRVRDVRGFRTYPYRYVLCTILVPHWKLSETAPILVRLIGTDAMGLELLVGAAVQVPYSYRTLLLVLYRTIGF